MSFKKLLLGVFGTALVLTLGWFFLIWRASDEQPTSDDNKIVSQPEQQPALVISGRLDGGKEEALIVAVGDIMLSRTVEQKMLAYKNFEQPFLKTGSYLKQSDLAFGNLETAITPGQIVKSGEMAFRADPKVADVLAQNKFLMLSLANNHTPNFGQAGLEDTFKYLEAAGIKYIGAGENKERADAPQYTEIKGIKIAWLARTEQLMVPENYAAKENKAGTAFWDKEEIARAVKEARQKADLVLVSLHAGQEYTTQPTGEQKEFARAAIEAGAEMVIGHHPHVVQMAEKYQGKYIFYSLGNFIFDQMWSQETREGIMLRLAVDKGGVNKIAAWPIIIEDFCQPRILADEQGEKIIKRLGLEFEKQGEVYILK